MHKYNTKFVNHYNENTELAVNTSLIESAHIVSQLSALICAQRASKPASESIPRASLQHVPEFIPRVHRVSLTLSHVLLDLNLFHVSLDLNLFHVYLCKMFDMLLCDLFSRCIMLLNLLQVLSLLMFKNQVHLYQCHEPWSIRTLIVQLLRQQPLLSTLLAYQLLDTLCPLQATEYQSMPG